jgi:hypothetical protein
MPWAPLSLLLRDMVGFEEFRFGLVVGCGLCESLV